MGLDTEKYTFYLPLNSCLLLVMISLLRFAFFRGHLRSYSLLLLHLQLDPQTVQTKNWHMDVIEMNGVRKECDCMIHPLVCAPDACPACAKSCFLDSLS